MTNHKTDSAVFFITSNKHIRNIQQLSPFMGFEEITIVTDVPSLSSNIVIFLDSYDLLENLHPTIIVMFMAYPLEKRLWLIEYSLRNNVPCIGIQEVNQLSLNNGRVNHYFTPLDGLAAASGAEKKMLENIPVPYARNIKVTGWGFFEESGRGKEEIKKSVIVFLSPLQKVDIVSIETEEVREKLLDLVRQFIELGYSVSIKPHPMEPKDVLEEQMQLLGIDQVRIIDSLNIGELLDEHEIIVNRGNSQICLEAVYMEKKLLIYPLGIKTIFDDCSNVLSDQRELGEKLDFLNTGNYLDQIREKKREHIPFAGDKALQNMADFINTAGQLRISDEKKALHLSLLYYICNKRDKAEELTGYFSMAASGTVRRFYRKPYSPKRFIEVIRLFKKDALISFYLTKIYIDHLAGIRWLRRFFTCDEKWIDFPDKKFIHYFWADTYNIYRKIYKC